MTKLLSLTPVTRLLPKLQCWKQIGKPTGLAEMLDKAGMVELTQMTKVTEMTSLTRDGKIDMGKLTEAT